ncbi:MAG: SCO family protein [Phycisphaerae bacterium]|nr:SCO family protein [Phycisphaerae bacterium]
MIRHTQTSLLNAVTSLVVGVAAASTCAQINTIPPELKGVDIIEHLNAKLPLDTTFTDEEGKSIKLGDLFKHDRPVILQLGYLRCPMLCGLVLNGAMEGLKEVEWTAGQTFDLVSISINPTEVHQLAKAKRDQYVVEYGRPGAVNGMHFLVGAGDQSKAVADAVGFQYREQGNGDYSHAAALFIITSDGRVSRYLYGATFAPKDLRLSLLEASEGKIGSTLDRFILWCHVYEPGTGYVLWAARLMQLAGVVTLIVIAGGLTVLWRQDKRRRRAAEAAVLAGPSV